MFYDTYAKGKYFIQAALYFINFNELFREIR